MIQHPDIASLVKQLGLEPDGLEVKSLSGGLTNKNYRITVSGNHYFLRVSDPGSSLLGINRHQERCNTKRAHEAGVGPELIAVNEAANALLIEWIEGDTLTNHMLQTNPVVLLQVATALKTLHGGPAFEGRFDFPALRRQYKSLVDERNYFLPPGYEQGEGMIARLEGALELSPERLAPCNNDLLAANFMYSDGKIRIIDYEYSGQNEPSFDIGNMASECGLHEAQLELFCNTYWGEHRPEKIARAKAWSLIARYGWVLWASIQEGISKIEFDFRGWGRQKWNSVQHELNTPNIESIISTLNS